VIEKEKASGINTIPDAFTWPLSVVHQGLVALAQASGWPVETIESLPAHYQPMDEILLSQQIELIAQKVGLEAEPVRATYGESDALVRGVAPGLLRVPGIGPEPRFLLLLRSNARWAYVLGRDLTISRLHHHHIVDGLWLDLVQPRLGQIETIVTAAGLDAHRRTRAERSLLAEMIGQTIQRGGWVLRLPPGAPLQQHIKESHLFGTFALLLSAYLAQLLLTVVAWWLIGRSALVGEFSWSWLWAWVLVLLTTIPFQLLASYAQRQITMRVGEIFKVRLLHGALQLQPEEIRHEGAGQFLGRVLAADMVEQVTIVGSFVTLFSVLQLVVAMWILSVGAAGWLQVSLLGGWSLLFAALVFRYGRANKAYVTTYRAMTNDLVERMVGHRTRLVQEDPISRHDDEDRVLSHYVQLQKHKDQEDSRLAFFPRGWMIVALAGFIFSLATIQPDATQLAITLGGILLTFRAFVTMTAGVRSLFDVRDAWKEVKEILAAATRPVNLGSHSNMSNLPIPNQTSAPSTRLESAPPLLSAVAVDFRYHKRTQPVLHNCTLHIQHGERILLTGQSGGGKSTLAGVLAGMRTPDAGQLMLSGHTQQTLGILEWRRRVVVVPQFHENYIFTGTLAFNLLMGRRWPPTSGDMMEAESLCRELGLGNLLDRMPAGLEQMVGESGWRLSHGERSRVYVARALLQNADLLILDESFGALDAESLQQTLDCVQRRVPSLVVIAHP
jgi:ATP-binding cassette subfamily B protein